MQRPEFVMAVLRAAMLAFSLAAPLKLTAEGPQRVALVIGNSGYKAVEPLKNPVNDAKDIASALSRIGFDVTLNLNVDDGQMRSSLKAFSTLSRDADLSLLYFAGHGIEIDKTNYLIPINAQLANDQDVAFEAIQLDTVVRAISGSDGVKIVLVDACRNNPFVQRLKSDETSRSIGIGLSRVDPVGGVLPGGIMISYAAREGTVALDGKGRNSPYAQGLLDNIEKPGLEVGKLFRRVRDRVFTLTEGLQEPFTYGSLPGDDIFLNQGQPGKVETTYQESSEALVEFYRTEWRNTPTAWRDFVLRHAEDENNRELVDIARRRLVALGADAMLRTLDKDEKPWLRTKTGLSPSGSVTLNLEERKLVQKSLMYMGYDLGEIDGQFGKRTRNAIAAARLAVGLTPGVEVDVHLLKRLPNVLEIDRLKSSAATRIDVSQKHGGLEPRLSKALAALKDYQVIFDYYRGHLYIAVNTEFTNWKQAYDLAKDAGGHLVTISDQKENDFVYNLFQGDELFFPRKQPGYRHGPHIGLIQSDRSNEPKGGWTWVTGESFDFSMWAPFQPSNGKNTQHYGRFAGEGAKLNRWADSSGYGGAFIMEVD